MATRRQFLKLCALAAAGMAVPYKFFSSATVAQAFSQSGSLTKFIQPLRGLGGSTGIPVAAPDTVRKAWWQPGVTHYTIDIGQYQDQLHPELPGTTTLRGFGQGGVFRHLGGIIAAKRDEAVQVTFRNNLPPDYILPLDPTIMDATSHQSNAACVHLHGGLVPWTSDGSPYGWFDPDGHRGSSFVNVLKPNLGKNEAEIYYPNDQGSRLMWYHDHTIGLTRTNAYSGIASGLVIYDDYELSLVKYHHLPGPLDPRTLYMIFQDKVFVRSDIESIDPTWPTIMPNSKPGDLWYAHEYDPARWEVDPAATQPLPEVSCIPEFFGDTMLVNGAAYPTLVLEQREYRLRMLNACQARFLNPKLMYAKGTSFPDSTEPNLTKPGPGFIQIGTEGGFLPYPAMVNMPHLPTLLMAPAERSDLLVDLRNVPSGTILILYSDAPAPYPMGDPVNDYFPGNGNPASGAPGYGPNTRTLLQIQVVKRAGAADPPITLPFELHPTDPFLVLQIPGKPNPIPNHVPVRYLTMNEDSDDYGRLIQRMGTSESIYPGTFGRDYMDDPTEVIQAGRTEVWEVLNLTGDVHPFHIHLTNAQILSRQPFDAENYAGGKPTYTGAAYAPDKNELGFKETIRMYPGEVTRILMKFDLPKVPFHYPESPRTGGYEYVWHCHILEHEEHDMMRPLIIKR
jgi:spore coat protein A, manganese oxidase